MSLRKLEDKQWDKYIELCRHPEHNPPMHIVLEPGRWEHTCPACGNKTIFTIPRVTC